MTKKIRWGILSTANIGRKRVIPAIQASSNGEVIAVASRSSDSAQAFAEEFGIQTAYGSYEGLLADPDVDAIYIPLPNHMHAEWAIRCAEYAKPTLCEKPLASDAAEAQTIVDAFEQHGVPVAEAFMYRFHPQTQRVKSIVDGGGIGELQMMRASFSFRLNNEENIRLQKSMAGGGLMDVGCYCINVMRFMTGEEPTSAAAKARIGAETGVDEALAGVLEFPSGVVGHFDCGLRAFREHSYELRGTHGRIVVETGFTMEANHDSVIRHWADDTYHEIVISAANHYQLMVEDFADALLNNRPPRFPLSDGVDNMRVIDALLASL